MLISRFLVAIYVRWHCRWHLKGAGLMLRSAAHVLPDLHAFPLDVPGVGRAPIDLRDDSGFAWLNMIKGAEDPNAGFKRGIASVLKKGDVLWDVGANAGCFAAEFSEPRYELSAIHAFEPNPSVYSTLAALFSRSGLVKTHNVALSDSDVERDLMVAPRSSSISTFGSSLKNLCPSSVRVRCLRGDSLVEQGQAGAPNVLKIDVEGHEPEVLAGLKGTIEQYRPTIVIEHIFLSDTTVSSLCPKGYACYTILDTTGELVPGLKRDGGNNTCMKPEPEQS